MQLTPKQEKDLETVLYFLPPSLGEVDITDKDIEDFFAFSERGVKQGNEENLQVRDGYHALLEGKRWRGIHMRMYEEGVMDASMPYYVILGGYDKAIPRSVVDFMKKEMFKGIDWEIIEHVYSEICAGQFI